MAVVLAPWTVAGEAEVEVVTVARVVVVVVPQLEVVARELVAALGIDSEAAAGGNARVLKRSE